MKSLVIKVCILLAVSLVVFAAKKETVSKKDYDSRKNSVLRRMFLHRQLIGMQKKSIAPSQVEGEPEHAATKKFTESEENFLTKLDEFKANLEEECRDKCDSIRSYSEAELCFHECVLKGFNFE